MQTCCPFAPRKTKATQEVAPSRQELDEFAAEFQAATMNHLGPSPPLLGWGRRTTEPQKGMRKPQGVGRALNDVASISMCRQTMMIELHPTASRGTLG